MRITILFFATLRDVVGARQIAIDLDGSNYSIEALRRELTSRYPAATDNLRVALAAINEEFAFDHDRLSDGDEVAFFPPVSGGSGEEGTRPELFRLARAPFNHDELVAAITRRKPAPSASSPAQCAGGRTKRAISPRQPIWNTKPTNRWRVPRCDKWRRKSARAGTRSRASPSFSASGNCR